MLQQSRKVAKAGNDQTNIVTIPYPQSDDVEYEYFYSFNEGQDWKEVT